MFYHINNRVASRAMQLTVAALYLIARLIMLTYFTVMLIEQYYSNVLILYTFPTQLNKL